MATTQAVGRELPASARGLRRSRRERAARTRAVYDQDADRTVRDARRVASPEPARVRRAYDPVARWLGLTSLAVVTLIVALIILR